MNVLQISAQDTYSIRSQMLRPGRPIEDCIFRGDDDEQTFHLGAFVESKLVSVASFYFEKHQSLTDEYQFRLRGMATVPDFQGQGLSSNLLKTAFPLIKKNFCTLLWCNARESALGFYQKVGFKEVGEAFDIPDIGAHRLMFIRLN
jgi:predicted GNAT family N-acyltransferase